MTWGAHPYSVCAADLDGDGDSDLAVANYSSNNVSILKNNGDGTFAAAVNYGVGINPVSVCAADLDGDGDSDLAVANSGSNDVSILINTSPAPTNVDPITKTPKSAIVAVYPNPFNPSVTIELYCSGTNTPVEIEIFDVSGKKVRTVFSGRLNTGANKFVWNGRSDSGASVSSGVYFCRLRSGNEINLKKVILLR